MAGRCHCTSLRDSVSGKCMHKGATIELAVCWFLVAELGGMLGAAVMCTSTLHQTSKLTYGQHEPGAACCMAFNEVSQMGMRMSAVSTWPRPSVLTWQAA